MDGFFMSLTDNLYPIKSGRWRKRRRNSALDQQWRFLCWRVNWRFCYIRVGRQSWGRKWRLSVD